MQPESTPKPAAPSPADIQRAEQLTKQLNSDSYIERITARKELLQLGRAAIEPLEYAARSEDSESRLRADELLITLRGRGFMGIGLTEKNAFNENENEQDEDARTCVLVNALPTFETPQYKEYGVTHEFPAKANGIEVGDKISAINGRQIDGIRDLMREVINVGPGRTALASVERDGKRLRIPMVLARNPTLMLANGQMIKDGPPPVDMEKEAEAAGTPETFLDQPAKMSSEKKKDPNATENIVRDIKKLASEVKKDADEAEKSKK
jgi:hypothetical protein